MKQFVIKLWMLLAAVQGAFFCDAQSLVSTVSGVVTDRVSKGPIEGALIAFSGTDGKDATTITGPDGRFTIQLLPGRYTAAVSVLGYAAASEEALAVSGHTLVLNFQLAEQSTELAAVTITARPGTADEEITLPIEKVLRMPANFFDPVRMLSSYPGVMTANDQANNIIVKGSSPSGLLWRLNGMDIVNPNHLANAGTITDKPTANGGGVNILSAQMLDKTAFYSGHIPARYGNFTSGVLDMSLRTGNNTKHEYTAQASLLGLDFAAEGPIKSGSSSFLANYRYSTVGLLSLAGVNFGGEAITFQDLSFHVNSKVGSNGTISFFGLGGLSRNDFAARDESEWEVDKDRFDINYYSNMGAVGSRYDHHIGSFNVSAGVTVSSNEQSRKSMSVSTIEFPGQGSEYRSERGLVSSFIGLTGAIGKDISLDGGVMFNYTHDELFSEEQLPASPTLTMVDRSNNSSLVQPYLQLHGTFGRLSVEGGGRYLSSTQGSAEAFDYRASVAYELSSSMSASVSGGRVSQLPQPGVYMVQGNETLGFFHKDFIELAHKFSVRKVMVTTTGYYHAYSDVPVEPVAHFSVLNMMDGIAPPDLDAVGTGVNKGVNIQAERSFLSSFYWLAAGSLYQSTYSDAEATNFSTRFDGRYAAQFTIGREKSRDAGDAKKAFGVHTRFMALGGLREYRIDPVASWVLGRTMYDESAPYSEQLNNYWRIDLRVSWRKDKQAYTRTIALDVQNVFAIRNEAYRYFDTFLGEVTTQYQVGFIPVLVYRIDF